MLGAAIPLTQRPCAPRIGSIQEVRGPGGFRTIAAVWRCDECATWQSAAVPSEDTACALEPCECGHVAVLKPEDSK